MHGNVSKNNGFDLNKQIIDAIDEKVEALIALKYILTVQKNNPNGVAGLDENGKLLIEQIPNDINDSLLAIVDLQNNKVDKADGMGLCNANFVSMTVYKEETAATIGVRKNSDGVLITYEDFYTKKGTNEKLSAKQDKVEGKTLTSNDFTDTDKAKLDGLENYNDTAVKALISGKADKANEDGGFNGGQSTQATQGGAVGKSAVAGDGFAGGKNAQATKNDEPIDAVQLGTGINQNPKTLQVYSYQLMDSTGHIPNDRMPTKSDKAVYYNPTTAGAITYDLKNEHNRMTSYIGADAATSVTISVSNGAYRNDYISGLSFYTGSTAPEVSYPASPYTMYFIGAECTTSNGMSVFSPLPNKVYDIVFYFNGGYIIGLVVSYDHVA